MSFVKVWNEYHIVKVFVLYEHKNLNSVLLISLFYINDMHKKELPQKP